MRTTGGARRWGWMFRMFKVFGTILLVSLIYAGFIYVRTLKNHPDFSLLNSTPFLREKMKISVWLPLPEMSGSAVEAIVISEDGGFYRHTGYDLSSIRDAVKTDILSLKFKRGASTITQQVMKNVFLNSEKSMTRKIEELALAQEAEKAVTKDRLLEIYLNTAQFGANLFGLEAASLFYFHKRASELTAKEGAFLAMLLPNPVRYQRSFRDGKLTPYADRTITSILLKMVDAEKMSLEEFNAEKAKPFTFELIQEGTPTPVGDKISPSPSAITHGQYQRLMLLSRLFSCSGGRTAVFPP